MSNKLRFDLQLKPHPTPEIASARLELWGKIGLYLITLTGQIEILQFEWNVDALAEWFTEHQHAICHETLTKYGPDFTPRPAESLAQALNRLEEQDVPEGSEVADQWYDALYQFRESHSLRFAFRGVRVPPIIIGCNHNRGEVSLSTKVEDEDGEWWDESLNGDWSYIFDMNDFYKHTHQVLLSVLRAWVANSIDSAANVRANSIIARLQDDVTGCC